MSPIIDITDDGDWVGEDSSVADIEYTDGKLAAAHLKLDEVEPADFPEDTEYLDD